MIDFNQNDFNLTKIRHETKLGNLTTRNKYRIYGLRQENNPLILVEYHYDKVCRDFDTRIDAVVKFFKTNGIDVDVYNESEANRVDIGLRKDLRGMVNKHDQPIFAATVLSTIVYCLEGRIDLDQMSKYKLSKIPKITIPVQTVQPA